MRFATCGTESTRSIQPAANRYQWLIVILLIGTGVYASIVEAMIIGVASPSIQRDFGASRDEVQWISTSFRLGQAIFLPAAVWAARRFGLRQVFMSSLALYGAVGVALYLFAGNLETLIGLRVLLSAPSAMMPIATMGIMLRILPAEKKTLGSTIYIMIIISGPGFAPVLGGLAIDNSNWRTIFLISAPVAMIALIASALLLPPIPRPPRTPFDPAGFACLAIALPTLLLAASKGQDWGWASYRFLILAVIGINFLALFIVVELQVDHPLLDLRVFSSATFTIGLLMVDVIFVGMYVTLSFGPGFLQSVQGLTATNTGLAQLPQALAWIAAMPLATYLTPKLGTRWASILGLAILAAGSLGMTRIDHDTPRTVIMTMLGIHGLGLGMSMIPVLSGTVAALPIDQSASGILFRTMVQRIISAMGLAIFSAVLTVRESAIAADRFALAGAIASHDPRIAQMRLNGPTGLLGLWSQTQTDSLAQAYREAFLLLGLLTVATIPLALFSRWAVIDPTAPPATVAERNDDVARDGA